MKLWPWQWQAATTTGVGSAVARAEHHQLGMEKNVDIEHVRLHCRVPQRAILMLLGRSRRCRDDYRSEQDCQCPEQGLRSISSQMLVNVGIKTMP
jgi:hypothetical protein